MKFIINLFIAAVIIALLAFVAYPYVTVFQLDKALIEQDTASLRRIVDLDAIRTQRKKALERDTNRVIGKGEDQVSQFFREGARLLGDKAVDRIIDENWLLTRLRRDGQPGNTRPYPSFLSALSYAFFESWDRFLLRLGELGDDPVHIEMSFSNWTWRVVAIYD